MATTTTTEAPPSAPPRRAARPRQRWQRHQADLARLIASTVAMVLVGAVGWLAPDGLHSFSLDLIALVRNLPLGLTQALIGVVQVVAIAVPLAVVIGLVIRRRFDLLGIAALAAVVAGAVMALITGTSVDPIPVEAQEAIRADSWITGAAFPSATYLAGFVAALVAGTPWIRRRWRHAAWIFVALLLFVRVLTATSVPLHIALLVLLGSACGSVALLVFGAPPRRVDEEALQHALAAAGLDVVAFERLSAEGRTPVFRADHSGHPVFVKVIGRDERDTDVMFRIWRAMRVKGMGDDRPVASSMRAVEHEALALAVATGAGARTLAPLAVAETPDEAAVLATAWADGVRLADLPDSALTDELLDGVWQQAAALQRRRIAHRSLRPTNVLVRDGIVTVIDFRRADLAASDTLLGADVAELATALSARLGAERVVASAARVLTTAELARALPLVQRAVLSRPTRELTKADKALLGDVRGRIEAATGVAKVELAKLHRVTLRGVVMLIGSLVLVGYVTRIVANWSEIWATLKTAEPVFVLWMVVAMILTYVAGGVSMLGSVTVDLPFVETTVIQFAQAFLNRFTPANAGGMALRARYMQLHGVDLTVAATAVGLQSGASGVCQVVFLVVFLVWGGQTGAFSRFSVPSTSTLLLVLVVLVAAFGIVALSGWGKRVVLPWARKVLREAGGLVRKLARDPVKSAQLFGGAAAAKLFTIVAFWLSIHAFGQSMSFGEAGALYMVANTVGSAVPTPGGVGGIEAALTAVLLSAGMDNATAAAIVLLFRFITYWLPTLPGWGALQWVQHEGVV